MPILNYADGNLDAVGEMLAHPHTVPGLSDGGAHVGTICDGSFPTTLLMHWGRDRTRGERFEVPWLIKRQTADTAAAVGLLDRGLLAPGYRADINVIDMRATRSRRPAPRLRPSRRRQAAAAAGDGYCHTFVAGEETYVDGEATGALPGRLVRGAQPVTRERRSLVSNLMISADSHITEPPNTYIDYIDPAFRDRAPKMIDHEKLGDVFVIDGMSKPISLATAAAAGKRPDEIRSYGAQFDELHRGGWDPNARLADQVRDGVAAEIIYPTVGMILCNHTDLDYKRACFEAYNRWIAEYCAAHPDRLLGLGQTAMRSPEEGIADLHAIKALGLRGVMMPGEPGARGLRLAHLRPVLGGGDRARACRCRSTSSRCAPRRPAVRRWPSFLSIVRGCQDIMAMLVMGGVFERHPEPAIVCAEADAGWVPHFMYRMDHAYKRHRYWLPAGQELSKLPSEYFAENIYVDVPGRLDGVQACRRHELAAADVGQRLPAQRLHVAVEPGDARRAHAVAERASRSRRSSAATSAELYRIDTAALV